MITKISASKIAELKRSNLDHFPRYSTYLINQASQTAQATRPSVVGQLSNEYPLYEEDCKRKGIHPSLEGWKNYHQVKYPNAVKDSVQKTTAMIQGFKAAINSIDSALIKEWVEDLLYDKTFYGFNLESTIKLFFIDKGLTVQNATAGDESKNIDLYVNGKPYQIKPKSLEHKQSIKSYIGIPIIYYYKEENSLVIDCDDKYLSALL